MAATLFTFILFIGWSDYVFCFYNTYNVSDSYVPLTAITMDSLTGNIYIGGTNIFMHLDENLMMKKKLSMGPKLDNPNCPPMPEMCSEKRNLLDNNVRIVEINNKTDYILVCGTAWQGLCTAHSLSDISENREFPHTAVTSYIGSNTSSVAFFGHMNRIWQHSDDKLLYVAMGTDGRPVQFAPAVVSVREVNNTGSSWHVDYFVNAVSYHSYIDVHSDLRNKFQSYYIYGFENGSYTYFLSVQMKDPLGESVENNQFVTKIIQICQQDVTFASYSELPIQCTLDGKTYHLATAAHFGFEHNLIPVWDKKLFVTFGKNDEFSPNPDPSEGSVMCVFSIQSITEKFQKLQEDCFINGRAFRPAWVYGDSLSTSRPCTVKPNAGLDKFCGSQPNVGIQDNPNMALEHVLTDFAKSSVSKDIYTSVSSITQNAKTVAILGTLSGYLLKIPSHFVMVSWMFLYKSKKRSFIHDCVGSGDPLSCGWCGDFCTTKTECIKPSVGSWSSDTCPPHIEKIKPSAGPTNGRTYLTITGKNFGNSNELGVHKLGAILHGQINHKLCRTTKLTIASKMSSEAARFTSIRKRGPKRIVCVTPEIQSPGDYPVKLTVKDTTSSQLITELISNSGLLSLCCTRTQVTLPYMEKTIISVLTDQLQLLSSLVLYLYSGNITIYGENYDISIYRSVTVAYFPCTLLSGGIDIKCYGTNLNVIANPKISRVLLKTVGNQSL
ncbi:hypothetical protein KUTeg_005811, partial [Tegillarca granosa]